MYAQSNVLLTAAASIFVVETWSLSSNAKNILIFFCSELCNFVQKILANLWTLWNCTARRPKTLKSVFFIYQINLLLYDSANKEYQL